ncbi:MAG: hypothetical protein LBC84_07450 [Prevotellaceae bacterium]|nr:hypothetical protein [Prevotellaceae bacterium]
MRSIIIILIINHVPLLLVLMEIMRMGTNLAKMEYIVILVLPQLMYDMV